MLSHNLSLTHGQPILFIGAGGCGSNILKYITTHLEGKYASVAINDDKLSLRKLESIPNHILLSKGKLSEGDTCVLKTMASQAQTVCVFLGIGGRTGTKASIEVLENLKPLGLGSIVVAVAPFDFEKRVDMVKDALQGLSISDYLVTLPNQKLIEMAQPNQSLASSFENLNKQILSLFQ
jgi:cell division GTPase FtsZ